MDIFLSASVTDVLICAGYRFHDFVGWLDDVAVTTSTRGQGAMDFTLATSYGEATVTLVDTGEATSSGGRLGRVQHLLDGTFFMTYADGLADVDLDTLLQHHRQSGAGVTLTGFPLRLRYGIVEAERDQLLARRFQEKPVMEGMWCNGGFYVVEPSVVQRYCSCDEVNWEAVVLPKLAAEGSLGVLRHDGYWASMDFPHQRDDLRRTWREQGPVWLSKGT
jgi:glucose-1-phosphate cytidylyltransferase